MKVTVTNFRRLFIAAKSEVVLQTFSNMDVYYCLCYIV